MKGRANLLFARTLFFELFTTGLLRTALFSLSGAIIFFGIDDTWFGVSMICFGMLLTGVGLHLFAMSPIILMYLGLWRTDPLIRPMYGARELSMREMQVMRTALGQIQNNVGHTFTSFDKYFVIDAPLPSMFSVGSMLFVTSSTLENPHLPVMLAHELGHLQNGDSYIMLALLKLSIPLGRKPKLEHLQHTTGAREMQGMPSLDLGDNLLRNALLLGKAQTGCFWIFLYFTWALAMGGGVRLTAKAWAKLFRERDYLADEFVVKAGMRAQLLQYLEEIRLFQNSVSDDLGVQAPIELRIEHLLF